MTSTTTIVEPPAVASATRTLLTCGVVAGPLFVLTALAQSATREGFELGRHQFSALSLGSLGWIQITNFLVSGLLFIAAAVGIRRAVHDGPGAAWGPVLIGAFGASMVGGGVFVMDPSFGFPPGAPAGFPATMSWHGTLHMLTFMVGFASLTAATAVFARRFAARGEQGWAWYTAASALAFVVLTGLGVAAGDFRIIAVAISIGWGWASLLAAHLRARQLTTV